MRERSKLYMLTMLKAPEIEQLNQRSEGLNPLIPSLETHPFGCIRWDP